MSGKLSASQESSGSVDDTEAYLTRPLSVASSRPRALSASSSSSSLVPLDSRETDATLDRMEASSDDDARLVGLRDAAREGVSDEEPSRMESMEATTPAAHERKKRKKKKKKMKMMKKMMKNDAGEDEADEKKEEEEERNIAKRTQEADAASESRVTKIAGKSESVPDDALEFAMQTGASPRRERALAENRRRSDVRRVSEVRSPRPVSDPSSPDAASSVLRRRRRAVAQEDKDEDLKGLMSDPAYARSNAVRLDRGNEGGDDDRDPAGKNKKKGAVGPTRHSRSLSSLGFLQRYIWKANNQAKSDKDGMEAAAKPKGPARSWYHDDVTQPDPAARQRIEALAAPKSNGRLWTQPPSSAVYHSTTGHRRTLTDFVFWLLSKFFTYRLPHAVLPFFPQFVWNVMLEIVLVLLIFLSPDSKWDGEYVLIWFVLFVSGFGTYFIVEQVTAVFFWLISQFYFASRLFYFIRDLVIEISMFSAAVIVLTLLLTVATNIDANSSFWITRTSIAIIVGTLLSAIAKFLTHYFILRVQQNQLWPTLQRSMQRESIVYRLMYDSVHESPPSTLKTHELSKGSFATMLEATSHVAASSEILGMTKSHLWKKKNTQSVTQRASEAAQSIFERVKGKDVVAAWSMSRGSRALVLTKADISRVLRDENSIAELFSMCGTDIVSRPALAYAISNVIVESSQISDTLLDRDNVSRILYVTSRVLFFAFYIMLLFIIVEIDIFTVLVPLTSAFLGLSFMFGESLKFAFHGILLNVVTRPFFVGDRVILDGIPASLIVSRLTLLTTELFSTDGRKFIVPNDYIFRNILQQRQTTRDYVIDMSFRVGINTTWEQLNAVRSSLEEWMQEDICPWAIDNPGDWMFYVSNIVDLTYIEVSIWLGMKGVYWHKPGIYLNHRSDLWLAIRDLCFQNGITIHQTPLPVQADKSDRLPHLLHRSVYVSTSADSDDDIRSRSGRVSVRGASQIPDTDSSSGSHDSEDEDDDLLRRSRSSVPLTRPGKGSGRVSSVRPSQLSFEVAGDTRDSSSD